MTHYSARKCPCSPRSPALVQAIGHALSPRVTGGLLAISLVGLPALALTLELSDLDGTNGFMINGIHPEDISGYSVSTAGDINGDGIDDILIGARGASPNGNYAGQSYVVFGTRTGFPAALELAGLDGRNGFILNGIHPRDLSSRSVSNAGDVSGDGLDDLIIGAPWADPNGSYSGQSYVVFGNRADFPAVLELSGLNGSNGFAINGIQAYDFSGWSVSGAGDVNGDGLDDLIIGATDANQSYLVFGTDIGFPAAVELSDLNGTNGFTLNGAGSWVSDAGDVNGDGLDDLIIGGRQNYVVFGAWEGFPAVLELSNLNGTNGFILNGTGGPVSDAGDVNGDSLDDLIIGAPGASPDGRDYAGQSYVVLGTNTGFPATLELSNLNGTNGFAINGINEYDSSGTSVSGAGDVNGDGFDDLIIGAPLAGPNGGVFAGQSYGVLGTDTGFPPTLELSELNGTNGFIVNGIQETDRAGAAVSGAGDVNGDGLDDLIIGAPLADPNGDASGQSYVVFGEDASLGPLTTVGLYDPTASRFYLRHRHAGGPADSSFRFGPGELGWLPLSGDWSGEGTVTIGLYDPVAGQFYLRNSLAGGPADTTFRFGPREEDWQPLSGDWDGDGQTMVGLYNPASGTFFLKNSPALGPADSSFRFGPGGLGWLPIAGDWDGDGVTTVGLYDPVTSRFYLNNSHAGGAADSSFRFGPSGLGWLPLSGDWNGDGVETVGLYDPATSRFYLNNRHAGGAADLSFRFGLGGFGWLPITGQWTGP